MSEMTRVRKPAVAGSFYPTSARKLRSDIESYLANAKGPRPPGRPLVLIEPHAGYMYSGQIAAYGYKLISGLDIRSVAIISPSHFESFPFSSVFDGGAYDTPLGALDVDTTLAAEIASAHPQIRLSDRGHIQTGARGQEHALEVQLPFLQTVLDDFRIVPIVMGDQSWDCCAALGEALSPYLARPDFLVVASSDLSHFHAYDAAQNMDETFCTLLESMSTERLYESIRQRKCEACGAGPVIAALMAASRVGASTCRVLHAANSGDVTGDHSRVVGYAAAVVFDDNDRSADGMRDARGTLDAAPQERGESLTPAEKTHLLDLARASVELAVAGNAELPPCVDSPRLVEPRGAFVTLKIRGRLRGCIGTIEPLKPLRDIVAEMARAAALSDPRFDPLTEDELPVVDFEISAMSPPRRIRSADDVTIGTHGIIIEKGLKRGLLLPQVATEHGWDAETFLGYACEKAGLGRDAWHDTDTTILVFSADVFGG